MSKPPRPHDRAHYIKGGTAPEHYPDPTHPEFAFVGRSNAGKSTLINALSGVKALARTSSTPGRTQAIQFFHVDRGPGRDVVFADLPGYGYAQAPSQVRSQFLPMVRRYLGVRDSLAGVVLIADIRRDPTSQEEDLLDLVEARQVPLLLVLSKSDKLSKSKIKLRVREVADAYGLGPDHFFAYSGLTSAGTEAIWQALDELAADWRQTQADALPVPALLPPDRG